MKIKKFKSKQILKLHLLNSRSYEHIIKKSQSGSFIDFSLTQIISDFKKVLHVIYQFHCANKKVLFIGIPKKLELKINKLTPHVAIPDYIDLKGILSNSFKQQALSKVSPSFLRFDDKSLLSKQLSKPDLIVIFSGKKKQTIINASHAAKIPLIIFNGESVSTELIVKSSYKVHSIAFNSASVSDKSLFFLGLNFLFKKYLRKK